MAVIEGRISPARTRSGKASRMCSRKRHAPLVRGAADGPFIGLCVQPVAAIGESFECADVLDDAIFLLVGFLDQEAVGLNWRRGR